MSKRWVSRIPGSIELRPPLGGGGSERSGEPRGGSKKKVRAERARFLGSDVSGVVNLFFHSKKPGGSTTKLVHHTAIMTLSQIATLIQSLSDDLSTDLPPSQVPQVTIKW